MNFKLTNGSHVIRLDDGAVIPNDPGNADWQGYQTWLAAGNTPAAADPPLQIRARPTPREWLERLSPATQLALETAALTNAQVSLWLRKATGASDGIDVTLQETKDGVTAMVVAGLITPADQEALLAP